MEYRAILYSHVLHFSIVSDRKVLGIIGIFSVLDSRNYDLPCLKFKRDNKNS